MRLGAGGEGGGVWYEGRKGLNLGGGMYIVCLNVINLTKMAWMVIHFLSLVDVLVAGGGWYLGLFLRW